MGFFSDLKDDLSQAVNELMPEEGAEEPGAGALPGGAHPAGGLRPAGQRNGGAAPWIKR